MTPINRYRVVEIGDNLAALIRTVVWVTALVLMVLFMAKCEAARFNMPTSTAVSPQGATP